MKLDSFWWVLFEFLNRYYNVERVDETQRGGMDSCVRSYRCNMAQYEHLDCISHVSALQFTSNGAILFAGMGSFMHCYLNDKHVIKRQVLMSGERIHGIRIAHEDFDNACFEMWVFGGRRLKLMKLNIDRATKSLEIRDLFDFHELSDWVFDVLWIPKWKQLLIGYAHNFVEGYIQMKQSDVFNFENAFHAQCEDRSLLYSMGFYLPECGSLEDVKVACGTVFNEIIIWELKNVLVKGESSQKVSPIIQVPCCRVRAHDGVIFNLQWMNIPEKPLSIISVSDDRTVKVWSYVSNSELVNIMAEYSHLSRVFRCCSDSSGLTSFFVSGGEDGQLCVWDLKMRTIASGIGVINSHDSAIWAISCHFDHLSECLQIASGSADGAIFISKFYRNVIHENMSGIYRSSRTIQVPQLMERSHGNYSRHYARSIHFIDWERTLVVCNLGVIYELVLGEWNLVLQLPIEEDILCSILDREAMCLAIGTSTGRVILYDILSRESYYALKVPSVSIISLFLTCGYLIISCSDAFGEFHCYEIVNYRAEKLCKVQRMNNSAVTNCKVFESYLIIADVKGFLSLCSLESGECLMRINPHNKKRIMDILLDLQSMEIWTVGRNGCLCKFRIDCNSDGPALVCIGGLSSTVNAIDRLEFWNVNGIRCLVGIGFELKDMIIWNFTQKVEICRLPSKGGQRPFDLFYDSKCQGVAFSYLVHDKITGGVVFSEYLQIEDEPGEFKFPLGMLNYAYHTRLITSVQLLGPNLFISASEDNAMKLIQLDKGCLKLCSSVERRSREAIRSMSAAKIDSRYLVCSVGVSEQIQIYQIDAESKKVETLATAGGTKFQQFRVGKWWKKEDEDLMNERQQLQDLRSLSVSVVQSSIVQNRFIIFVGNSAGAVKLLSYDINTRQLRSQFESMLHKRPVISSSIHSHEGRMLILSGDTSGSVFFWALCEMNDDLELELITSRKILQSGVNSLSQVVRMGEYTSVVLGGDDQSISVLQFKWNESEISQVRCCTMKEAHGSAVNGVAFVSPTLFTSTSYDKRIVLWYYNWDYMEVSLHSSTLVDTDDISGITTNWNPTENSSDSRIAIGIYGSGISVVEVKVRD